MDLLQILTMRPSLTLVSIKITRFTPKYLMLLHVAAYNYKQTLWRTPIIISLYLQLQMTSFVPN